MIRTLSAAALLLTAGPALAAAPIAGRYVTEDGSALIEVGRCGNEMCGRIARVLRAAPGAPATDVNNGDQALRTRPIVGLPILTGFTESGDAWRGRIYDPRNGRTYRSVVSRNPDGSLKVEGCVAIICRSQTWRPAR